MKHSSNIVLRYFASLLAALVVSTGLLAAEPVSKSAQTGVAIGGHDSAAYHNLVRAPQQSALAGAKSYSVEYKGAIWQFSSQANADAFASEPERYSPAYNGHCANALSLGRGLLETDGTNWEIFENKLYLFYAPRGRDRWMAGDWKSFKLQADAEWATLSK